jgi:hypothetical protein
VVDGEDETTCVFEPELEGDDEGEEEASEGVVDEGYAIPPIGS